MARTNERMQKIGVTLICAEVIGGFDEEKERQEVIDALQQIENEIKIRPAGAEDE